jgi:hypothetical protein
VPWLYLTPTQHPDQTVVIGCHHVVTVLALHPQATYLRLTDGRTLLVRESLYEILSRCRAPTPFY